MRIAVTYEDGEIFQHFGHTAQFKVYDVAEGCVISAVVVDTNGHGHGALAGFLKGVQADVLICGGIGGGARMALAEAIRLESLAEEIRILYVALTRAKEKLILTGAVKNMEKALQKWTQTAETGERTLPLFRLRRAKNYLDWVMPSYLRHPSSEGRGRAL